RAASSADVNRTRSPGRRAATQCANPADNGGSMKDLVAVLVRFVTGAQRHWCYCQPRAGQRVYIANHSSHLDFLVLWAVLPRTIRASTRPVAAKDYWERNTL